MKNFSRLPLALGAGVALVLSVPGVLSTPAAAQIPVAVSPAAANTLESSHADTILVKVNELRAAHGLAPLTRYVELDAVAQDWSEQMSRTGDFEHRPGFSVYPAGWDMAAENIAYNHDAHGPEIGLQLFEQWRKSPGHLENMLRPNLNAIGIGVSYNPSNGRWYGTQNFANYPDPASAGLTPLPGGSQPGAAPAAQEAPGDDGPSVSQPEERKPEAGTSGPAAPSEPKKEDPPAAVPAPPAADKPKEDAGDPAGKPQSHAPKKNDATQDASKHGKSTGKHDSKVVEVPSGKQSAGPASGKPEVVVAAPEKGKAADGTTRLPATGVSSLAALAALGLAGAGTTVFVIRSRRRA